MSAMEPVRDKKQLRQLAHYWLARGNLRNYALIVLGVYTALRTSDLLWLKWSDVYDTSRGIFRNHIVLLEKKTKKKRMIALNPKAVKALELCLPRSCRTHARSRLRERTQCQTRHR